MFRNYLTAALRNLARNKLYAAINIIGLAVGLTASILIFLFARDEFSYDQFIPGADHVYAVYTVARPSGQSPLVFDSTAGDLAAAFKLDFPTIGSFAQIVLDNALFSRANAESEDRIYWADTDLFSVVPLPVFAGELNKALARPDGIVLTRRMARKYFGHDNPIGQTIEIRRPAGRQKYLMTVTAVVENLPSNTNLAAEIFVSGLAEFGGLVKADEPQKDGDFDTNVQLLICLAPDQSIDELRRGLTNFVKRHVKMGDNWKVSLELRALNKLHLLPNERPDFKPSGSLTTLYFLATVGLLILIVASINFVNLMTARVAQHSVEIGIRKVAGARRSDIIVQFISETLIYATLSILLALTLTELALPFFNAFLARDIAFRYWADGELLIALIALALCVGVLAGFYPAIVLSRIRPILALKADTARTTAAVSVRQLLVVAQFAILVGLLIVTSIVYRQKAYAMNQAFHLDKDNVALIRGDSVSEAFTDQLRGLPGIHAVAASSEMALGFEGFFDEAVLPDDTKSIIRRMPVGFGFLEFYGLKPLAGRFFARDHVGDAVSRDPKATWHPTVVLNEAAVRLLLYPTPQAAIGKSLTLIGVHDDPSPSEIIGVVSDFSFRSVRQRVDPSFYFVDPAQNDIVNVKLQAEGISQTLMAVDALARRMGIPGTLNKSFLVQHTLDTYFDVTRQGTIFTVFTVVAVFIACLGLFGLSAFSVQRRTKEIGIRKALGADTAAMMRLLVWQFSKPVLWANLIAWPIAALVMNRWLHGFAYHIDLEPWLFVASTALALVIALLTVSAHCYLVARAKPITALRYE